MSSMSFDAVRIVDVSAAEKAQGDLPGDHGGGQYGTSLNINEINVEPVFLEESGFAHHVDDPERSHRRWVTNNNPLQFLRVRRPEGDRWKNHEEKKGYYDPTA